MRHRVTVIILHVCVTTLAAIEFLLETKTTTPWILPEIIIQEIHTYSVV